MGCLSSRKTHLIFRRPLWTSFNPFLKSATSATELGDMRAAARTGLQLSAAQIRQLLVLRATGGISEHGGEPSALVPHESCRQRDGLARQLPSVTVRRQESAARRATHANDHQRGLPIHRPGTLPSDPQIVQPVTPCGRHCAKIPIFSRPPCGGPTTGPGACRPRWTP